MTRIRIDSIEDPRVLDYRDQKDAWLRVQEAADAGRASTGLPDGLFMAEGLLVVEQVLRSRHTVRSILGTPARLDALEDRVGTIPADLPVYVARQGVLDGIAGFSIHRGLLACARAAPAPLLDDLLARTTTLVVLEDLSNHDNVGGVFRNVAALGGEHAAVLLSPRCCDPLYRKAIRVSMGHVLRVPFGRSVDWPGDLERVKRAGFVTIALTPSPEAAELSSQARGAVTEPADADASASADARRVALLLGAEGPGLSVEAFSRADVIARIPMASGVDSLNVAVVCALALDRLGR
ncbi:RNA methyltransferase [Roseiflexus sp. AH-315-K22]|nr:RNA methyltransferase [Roseiflexus sp. AH-315-K22]